MALMKKREPFDPAYLKDKLSNLKFGETARLRALGRLTSGGTIKGLTLNFATWLTCGQG